MLAVPSLQGMKVMGFIMQRELSRAVGMQSEACGASRCPPLLVGLSLEAPLRPRGQELPFLLCSRTLTKTSVSSAEGGLLQAGELWATGPSWSSVAVVRDTVSASLALEIEACGRMAGV